MRVLLVDDNPDDRVLVRRELDRHFPDFDIEEIRAALDLRRALETAPVDLVITDFELRWSNGLEILERVKGRYPDCPVVMFTATGTQEIAVAAMKAGLDDYVIKSPKHYVRLPAAVDGALRHATARARARQRRRRFDEILSAIGVGVLRATPEGEVKDANDAMLAFLGASSPEQLRSLDATALVHAVRRHEHAQTVRLPRVDGGGIDLRVSGGLIEDADGASVVEAVVRPVTGGP
jgi:DNA-binding NarL/FixJ family response regulator